MGSQSTGRQPRVAHRCTDVGESLAQSRRWTVEQSPTLASVAITRQQVESYLAKVDSTRSLATAQTRYNALCLFYPSAAEEARSAPTPTASVKPLIVPEQPLPVLTAPSKARTRRPPPRCLGSSPPLADEPPQANQGRSRDCEEGNDRGRLIRRSQRGHECG